MYTCKLQGGGHVPMYFLFCRTYLRLKHVIVYFAQTFVSLTLQDFYTQISWFMWKRSCYNSENFFRIILVFSKVMAL